MAIVVDAFYLVLDAIVITLGLLFVWKWGKSGLLAMTMWLLVVGLMAYAIGDGLFLAGTDLGYKTGLFSGTAYEMDSSDFAFIAAVVLWIVAFFIPVKFAFFDAKKPGAAARPGPAQAQGAPQQQTFIPQQATPRQFAAQQQAPPSGPQYQGQAPQPAYTQQAPPPAYQQAPPAPYQQQQPRPPYPQQPQK